MKKKILVGLPVIFGLALTVFAQEVPDHKISEFSLGDHISGEEVDLKKLKGRVVAIEKWGVR